MDLGPLEIGLILVIVLIVFGAGKLPEVGSALGKALKEFRKAKDGITEEPNVVSSNVKAIATKAIEVKTDNDTKINT